MKQYKATYKVKAIQYVDEESACEIEKYVERKSFAEDDSIGIHNPYTNCFMYLNKGDFLVIDYSTRDKFFVYEKADFLKRFEEV